MKSSPITFRTSWWKGGYENQVNHTGTLVYDHPLTRAMAPEGWCDGGWFYLIEAALRYDLESGPARPDVIIRGLPTIDPVKDQARLFEVGVGKGCLIVSGLNHRGAAGRPENAWLMAGTCWNTPPSGPNPSRNGRPHCSRPPRGRSEPRSRLPATHFQWRRRGQVAFLPRG